MTEATKRTLLNAQHNHILQNMAVQVIMHNILSMWQNEHTNVSQSHEPEHFSRHHF